MTYGNPHPLANPLNSRSYQISGGFRKCSNAKLPVSELGYVDALRLAQERNASMPVPNQLELGPVGVPIQVQSRFRGVDPADTFTLHDGTILNIKTGQVLRSSQDEPGYWGKSSTQIDPPVIQSRDWTDNDIYGNPHEPPSLTAGNPGDDPYMRVAKNMSRKLDAEMTTEQRQLLAQFYHDHPSKFEDA